MTNHTNYERKQKGLIINDMIDGFLVNGALADPSSQRIVPSAVKITGEFINAGYEIVELKDWHTLDSLEFKTHPIHSVAGTKETELIAELKKFAAKIKTFRKDSTCGLFAPGFIEYIEKMENIVEWVMIGVCSDICDITFLLAFKSYLNQMKRDVNLVIVKNAVDTFGLPNARSEEQAIKDINRAAKKAKAENRAFNVVDVLRAARYKDEMNEIAFMLLEQSGIEVVEDYSLARTKKEKERK